MSFLPIAILAYALNAGATVVDKILLSKQLPNALVYVFYISVIGLLVIFLLPFGVRFELFPAIIGALSGITANFALFFYFESLKKGEASIVAPIVGSLNPLFSLLLGSFFLGQIISPTQSMAFFLLLLGTTVLTFNLWSDKVTLNRQLLLMVLSGLMFAISYVLLRQAFLMSDFITGLFFSRLSGGILVLLFLFFPSVRSAIFVSRLTKHHFANHISYLLMGGQAMGATAALLLTYAVSLTNPSLVNSLFGVQYLVILLVAILLKKHPQLLDEELNLPVIIQKLIGAGILSLGVYLLSR